MQFNDSMKVLSLIILSGLPIAGQAQEVSDRNSRNGMISGVVFDDENGDGRHNAGEAGVADVLVSNGRDIVRTDARGHYTIGVRDDMDLSVVQPAGWRVPVDERQVPRFSYTHKPGGTPQELRYGGLPDTGPAPATVNFPLMPTGDGNRFRCAILGDSQTYSNHEVSQFRDSAMADLISKTWGTDDCMLYVGDVVGDDLGLLDRVLEIGATAGLPQWLVHGNHDFDFDATDDAHSADSWRRLYGPNYYAFEIGEATFIVLDNIVYPCGPEDMERSGRDFCNDPGRTTYNARVTETQMEWLENLLAEVPEDRLIVLAHHAPLVSFVDATSAQHQTDNSTAIHQLLQGRRALSLSGHTHTLENLGPGEHFAGWREAVGVSALPFRHIVAGAVSGNWWQGDYNLDGDAQALQRLGAPKGVLMLAVEGTDYEESYIGSRIDPVRGQWVSFNTPDFRHWFDTLMEWRAKSADERDPIPPLSVNDLPDTRIITPRDLEQGVHLTVNVWAGSRETRVTADIGGLHRLTLERTQSGTGEAPRIGAMYADPFAARRQLTVGRYAIESRSGIEANQGLESFRGSRIQGPPQPQGSVADRNMHLWTVRLPESLPRGVHRVTVTSTDRHGSRLTDTVLLEVRDRRPLPRARRDIW
ncbi:MAG: calcineurin-like phosphoesterase C-terminal domain-containing protein [Pseudomonadota bacterium]